MSACGCTGGCKGGWPPSSARRAFFAGVLSALFLVALTTLSASPVAAQAGDVQTLITDTNSLRASLGLPPLELDPQLSELAQGWADHMASTDALEHPPDIEGPVSQPWTLVGDNMVFAMTVSEAWDALLASEIHYSNLTNPRFTHFGVGVARTPSGVLYAHQWFKAAGEFPEEEEEEEPVVEVPTETTVAPPVEEPVIVLGDVEFRAVNVAVIPPIEYGRPATAALPTDSSPSLPLISLLVALGILLLLLALLALRSKARRSA